MTEVWTIDEVAAACHVSRAVLDYHRKKGAIPDSTFWGGRNIYSPSDYEFIKAYFSGRKRYQRGTKEVIHVSP